jgi:hypothetical protein
MADLAPFLVTFAGLAIGYISSWLLYSLSPLPLPPAASEPIDMLYQSI